MTATADPTLPYRDPTTTVADRVVDLLDRMNLDEKLAQLGSAWVFQIAGPNGLDDERAAQLLAHGIGHITRIGGASSLRAAGAADLANQIQRHLVEHTRLGIPAIVHEEICSGLMTRDATIFPQAIGVASTFRPDHNRKMADAIRLQMRSVGAHQGLSPVLDVCRDPRWGRCEETYGEDPALVAAMGNAFIDGLQGVDLVDGVVATAKHFVGYGASEGGLNWAPAHLPERELRDVYLWPFETAVRDAALASVMNGYHELDGLPCGANRWLLTDLLRGEWGFDGTVVSDYFTVRQLHDYHHVVADPAAAAAAGLHAGIDVELPGTDCYDAPLREALASGQIDLVDVDVAVARVLDTKFRLGLFEQPFVDTGAARVHTRTPAQLDLARAIAADSLVLLKNDGVLPLASPRTVAVIGPNAASARNLLGDYSYISHVESLNEVLRSGRNVFAMPIEHGVDVDTQTDLAHIPTVVDALRSRLPSTEVTYVEGCSISGADRSGFDEAVSAAARSDVVVLVMGERAGLTDDCTTGESRDVASLDLPGIQEELVSAVAATGTPMVLVLVAGRPIGSPAVHDASAAVLMAWLPGEQGGTAIADAISGAVSPGGKLPITYPRSSGQIPIYHGHKVSGGRSHWKGAYVDLSNEPLYPFGHGLSYSTFTLGVDQIDGRVVGPGDVVDVTVTLANVGAHRADEVVQLYSRDRVASLTRPVRELQGFARATLDPGASTRITFHVAVDALGFTGHEFAYGIEAGEVEFVVGTSAIDVQPAGRVVIGGPAWTRVTRRGVGPATLDDGNRP